MLLLLLLLLLVVMVVLVVLVVLVTITGTTTMLLAARVRMECGEAGEQVERLLAWWWPSSRSHSRHSRRSRGSGSGSRSGMAVGQRDVGTGCWPCLQTAQLLHWHYHGIHSHGRHRRRLSLARLAVNTGSTSEPGPAQCPLERAR
jgi:hypothetical protein